MGYESRGTARMETSARHHLSYGRRGWPARMWKAFEEMEQLGFIGPNARI